MMRRSSFDKSNDLSANRPPAFRSNDLDETRMYVAGMFKQHRLEIKGAGSQLSATASRVDLGPITLVHLQHGADVFVDPEALEDFYLMQIPMDGVGQCIVDGAAIEMRRGTACIVSPAQRVQMHLQQDCRYLIMKVGREYLQAQLSSELDCSPYRPLQFQPDIQLCGESVAGVVNLIGHLEDRGFSGDPLYARHDFQSSAASMLVRSMLYSFRNNYSDRLDKSPPVVRPRYIHMAQAYVEAHLTTKLTPSEMAKAACMSVRALYRGFREHLDMTPMEYVKERRLLKIRELMSSSTAEHSVAELGLQFGFDHLGHFAASYRQRFGELPSQTLRFMR